MKSVQYFLAFTLLLSYVVLTASEIAGTTKITDNRCEVEKYSYKCCRHLDIGRLGLNGSLCMSAKYLDHDYGIEIALTYNNYTLWNESVSARNPPPICTSMVDAEIPVDICLKIYDIDITEKMFHSCFEGELMSFKIVAIKIPFGCVNEKVGDTYLWKKLQSLGPHYSVVRV